MADLGAENDYVSEAMQMENSTAVDPKISKSNASLSNSGKAHVSLIAIALIFIIAIFSNLGAVLVFGELISTIFGIVMGIVAIVTYPSLADSGYSVSKAVYLFIFSFMISISYLIGIILGGGIIGLIIMALGLYWILLHNNLIG